MKFYVLFSFLSPSFIGVVRNRLPKIAGIQKPEPVFGWALAIGLLSVVMAHPQTATSTADDAIEKEIRKLEQDQVNYLLQDNVDAMQKHWDPKCMVNNPFNKIVKISEGPIRQGSLTYSSFVRNVEQVLIHGTTVVVMGTETVVPKGISPDAGQTIRRRFTNVWMKKANRWLMIGRHANMVCEK
jgi:hypothetical protein